MSTTLDCEAINAARAAGRKKRSGGQWSAAVQLQLGGHDPGVTMETLALMIGGNDGVAGRVVFDRTGLDGRFEFTLRFAAPASTVATPTTFQISSPPYRINLASAWSPHARRWIRS
jgi:uncharacterized protein (TIGR03435 family)